MATTTDWMLGERWIEGFLNELKLEHLRQMAHEDSKATTVEPSTLISYNTFSKAYDKMDADFKSKCPKTLFAFSNNGLMQAQYEDLVDSLLHLLYYYEDYNELCYCDGEFSETISFESLLNYIQHTYLERYGKQHTMTKREFSEWTDFVKDHIKFCLNPFLRPNVVVTDVIESDILVQLRNLDISPWFRFETLNDFHKRFREAACRSEFSGSFNFLVKRDFHLLNVLEDEIQQPYSEEFTNRLFDYFAEKHKFSKDGDKEYRMDCRTFVNIRRMLFHQKSVATRRFLFEIVDLKGDGYIDVDEVYHFYNGLERLHCEFDVNDELPFPCFEEFYISWYDQIGHSKDCLNQRLSFAEFKNHPYGDEALMMLVNYKALMTFDRRFEPGSSNDPAADTVVSDDDTVQLCDEDGTIRQSELDNLLGPAILVDKTNLTENNNLLISPPSGMRILRLDSSPKSRQSF